jgi:hypothetical protein
MLRIGRECCPRCRNSNVHVSAPESLWEELAILLLLRPVRCYGCMYRFYRPLSIPTTIEAAGTAETVNQARQAHAAEQDEPRST